MTRFGLYPGPYKEINIRLQNKAEKRGKKNNTHHYPYLSNFNNIAIQGKHRCIKCELFFDQKNS